ncbi:hypothetical protein [Streptomyces sp. NPDC048445]
MPVTYAVLHACGEGGSATADGHLDVELYQSGREGDRSPGDL